MRYCIAYVSFILTTAFASNAASEVCPSVFGIEFVHFEDQAHSMGRNESRYSDERPRHSVEISSFCISRSHITFNNISEIVSSSDQIAVERIITTERDIQRALKLLGFYDGKVDGAIGPASRRAISNFQESVGIESSGRFDQATFDELKREALHVSNDVGAYLLSYREATQLLDALASELGVELRLPTEPEWDVAVRSNGVDRSDDNYWELTSSLYSPYPYNTEDGRETPDPDYGFRTLRGGLSEDPRDLWSIHLRGYAAPDTPNGFRLVYQN